MQGTHEGALDLRAGSSVGGASRNTVSRRDEPFLFALILLPRRTGASNPFRRRGVHRGVRDRPRREARERTRRGAPLTDLGRMTSRPRGTISPLVCVIESPCERTAGGSGQRRAY